MVKKIFVLGFILLLFILAGCVNNSIVKNDLKTESANSGSQNMPAIESFDNKQVEQGKTVPVLVEKNDKNIHKTQEAGNYTVANNGFFSLKIPKNIDQGKTANISVTDLNLNALPLKKCSPLNPNLNESCEYDITIQFLFKNEGGNVVDVGFDGPYIKYKQWKTECDTKTVMVGTNIILSTEKGATIAAGAIGKIGSTTLQTIEKIPFGTKAIKIAENTIEFLTPIKSTLIKADQQLDNIAWKIIYRADYLTTKYGIEATQAMERILINQKTYWKTIEAEGLTKTIASHPDSVVEGEAIIDSMIKSGEWTETMTKTATTIDNSGNLINFVSEKIIPNSSKNADYWFKINSNEYWIDSTKIETELTSEQNLFSKLTEQDRAKKFEGLGTGGIQVVVLEESTTLTKEQIESTIVESLPQMSGTGKVFVYDLKTKNVFWK